MHRVLVSSFHMNQVLQKFYPILKKNNIKIDKIIRNPSVKSQELVKIIHKYDGIICSDDELNKKVLSKAKNLKVISKWGTGIDSIDLKIAKKRGIKVFNSPGAFTKSVNQHAWALIFNLIKKINENDNDIRKNKWKKYEGFLLEKKTIGIIGFGKIGKEIARYARFFKMKILANDLKKKKFKNVNFTSKREILKKADIIILCVDLNKKSIHLMNKKNLNLLKNQQILINISRGPVIDEKSLINLLKKKKEILVGLDVFNEEPLKKKNFLKKCRNVILTSHNAFNTKDAVDYVHQNTILNLIKGLRG